MQDKIACNKMNEIREERMQTQFLYWFGKVRSYVQYSSNPLEIFHSLCKNPFTKFELHRDNSSLVFRNPYNLRDPQFLNQSLWKRKKKEEFSLEDKDITIEVHGKTLNGFASVCPRVSFERAFGNEVLLEYLSHKFCVSSHLFIGLWWPFKNLLNRCDSQELFSEELWLLEVIFWIFEFLTWIKLEKCLSLASSKSCIHTFTFSPFLMMTIKWFLFYIIKTMHDQHSPLFWWWHSLSQAWSFWHHQNLHDLHSHPFWWWQPPVG